MNTTENNSSNDFSDKVGTIIIADERFQLCDHVQKIEGTYFATAFSLAPREDGKNNSTGVYYKKLAAANLAFIPSSQLDKAEIVYDDKNQTKELIVRLKKAIENMNALKLTEVA